MTGQDLAAIAICVLALGWLVRRLLAQPRQQARPLVTRSALLKRTAEQRARPDDRQCH